MKPHLQRGACQRRFFYGWLRRISGLYLGGLLMSAGAKTQAIEPSMPASNRRTACAALGALLLPMLPGVAAAWSLQVYRPWFWVEFLLLASVLRGRPRWFALSLSVLWIADFLFIFAQINLSSNYIEVFDLLEFLPHANTSWIVVGVASLFALLGWGWLCTRVHSVGGAGRAMLWWALALAGIAVTVPTLNGFEHDEGKLYNIRHAKLVGSWVLDSRHMRESLGFYEEGYTPDFGKFKSIAAGQSAITRMESLDAQAGRTTLPKKLLLVVVESWGLTYNQLENQFWRDLWQSPDFLQLAMGTVHSQGSTLQGEFRELCGLIPQTLRIEDVPQAQECLPSRLRAGGWQTRAFNGASPRMYRNGNWYPQIGFSQRYFLPELIAEGKLCTNMPGICDYSIADRVVQTLQGDGRQFSYWMTLNSHTPYKLSDLSSTDVPSRVCPILKLQGMRCAHAALLYDFMQALKAALVRHPIPGLRIVLVGDHAAKFFDAESRDAFVENEVPYLILEMTDHAPANIKN